MLDQCPDLELIAAFLDGNITAEARALVEDHIGWCGFCRKLVAHVIKTEALVPKPEKASKDCGEDAQ